MGWDALPISSHPMSQGNDRSRHKPKLCIKKGTCTWNWAFHPDRYGARQIRPSHHSVRANIQAHDSASCRLWQFLAQFISAINTWRRTVRKKRSRTTYSWKYGWIKKGLPPPARWIYPGASRRWTLKQNFYRPDCRRNLSRTSIQLPKITFFFSLLTGKHLRWSHWTPVNMAEDFIERHDMFNTDK